MGLEISKSDLKLIYIAMTEYIANHDINSDNYKDYCIMCEELHDIIW